MVFPKLELRISRPPPPELPQLPPDPTTPVPLRDSSPWPCTLARISAVDVSIMRAVMVHTAVALEVLTPPIPKRLSVPDAAPPPTAVLLSSRPNWVMLPTDRKNVV